MQPAGSNEKHRLEDEERHQAVPHTSPAYLGDQHDCIAMGHEGKVSSRIGDLEVSNLNVASITEKDSELEQLQEALRIQRQESEQLQKAGESARLELENNNKQLQKDLSDLKRKLESNALAEVNPYMQLQCRSCEM